MNIRIMLNHCIKFNMEDSDRCLTMLDLNPAHVDGFIQTDVFSKPTYNHIYLHSSSTHPQHCIRAISYGVATRIRRNCSNDKIFQERRVEYQDYLIKRVHNPIHFKHQFDRIYV